MCNYWLEYCPLHLLRVCNYCMHWGTVVGPYLENSALMDVLQLWFDNYALMDDCATMAWKLCNDGCLCNYGLKTMNWWTVVQLCPENCALTNSCGTMAWKLCIARRLCNYWKPCVDWGFVTISWKLCKLDGLQLWFENYALTDSFATMAWKLCNDEQLCNYGLKTMHLWTDVQLCPQTMHWWTVVQLCPENYALVDSCVTMAWKLCIDGRL